MSVDRMMQDTRVVEGDRMRENRVGGRRSRPGRSDLVAVLVSTGLACLGVIPVPEVAANIAWGDADCRGLYVTARSSLYRVRLKTPGVPVPPAPAK
jgi:hypothetical protein